MKFIRSLTPALVLCALLSSDQAAAQAPSGILTTGLLAGNSQSGNMFDIRNLTAGPVNIQSFDQNVASATNTLCSFAIYTKVGTWVGSQTNAAAWTLVGTSAGTPSLALGTATPIPITCNVSIPAGATQGFFVIITNGALVGYTNGTLLGSAWASNGVLRLDEGCGRAWVAAAPFTGGILGGVTVGGASRKWNGRVHYGSAFPEYQTNLPGASLDINGIVGTNNFKAVYNTVADNICNFGSGTVNFASNSPGAPWDLAVTLAPALPTSTLNQHFGTALQVLNINLGDPSFFPLNGLGFTNAFVPFALPLAPGGPFVAGAQMVVLDGSSPDGFSLSQPNDFNVALSTGFAPGPSGDDASTVFSFADPQLCNSGIPAFTFFGVTYTQFQVNTNGRVLFSAIPDTSYYGTAADAMVSAPNFGCWTDLQTTGGVAPAGAPYGVSLATPAPGQVVVNYTHMNYWQTTALVGFSLLMDSNTGAITLSGLNSLVAFPYASPLWVGLSPGAPNATDGGNQGFGLGAAPGPANGTDMIYDQGAPGSFLGGITQLVFIPSGSGSYSWTGS